MTSEFTPPISDRETEELIEIAYCNDENIWQREATVQAKKELIKRNISQEQQNEIIKKWNIEAEKHLKEEAERLEKNKTESYTILQMVQLFLFGPLVFMNKYTVEYHTIFSLRSENYFLKFKQRIIIFILSFIAWFFFIKFTVEQSQTKRQEEIDKIDISDWKKQHGYD
ncbi:hypothetical protein [Thalassobellus citreus]|uniref:hypothetical protein n=1 Tax=Thalassobellus citreus TaxID=3367752 RepID=UPI0037B6C9B6